MESALQAETLAPTVGEDDAMERYAGVTLRAWRSLTSRVLWVDIGVESTPDSNIQIQEGADPPGIVMLSSIPNVLVLKLVPGDQAVAGPWSDRYQKNKSPPYRHVVLFGDRKLIAVASVEDMS